MRVTVTTNIELKNEIQNKLKENGGYCPCCIEHTPETKCMCKNFIEEVAAGEYCHCGLFYKAEA